MLRKLDNVDYATFIELPARPRRSPPGVSAKEIFDDGEQMLDACAELGLNIGAVMAVREARLTGEAHAIAAMRRVLDVMREETTAPIAQSAAIARRAYRRRGQARRCHLPQRFERKPDGPRSDRCRGPRDGRA